MPTWRPSAWQSGFVKHVLKYSSYIALFCSHYSPAHAVAGEFCEEYIRYRKVLTFV